MLTNRFQDYWNQTEFEVAASADVAFVPCPCPIIQSMTSVQQAQMEQLYRLAYEQAQSQVNLDRRPRALDFSAN
jgi:hypothetical protein